MLDIVRSVEFFREYGDKFRYSNVCYNGYVPFILAQRISGEINQQLESGNYKDEESVSVMAKDLLHRYEINTDEVTISCYVAGFSRS